MFFDTDCGGVVHNLAYLRHIETARTRLAAELGWNLREMSEAQCFPVVVRTEVDYRLPARLADHLRIDGWLEEVSRVRFWCAFKVHREEDNALLVTCRQQLAIITLPDGTAERLDPALAERCCGAPGS